MVYNSQAIAADCGDYRIAEAIEIVKGSYGIEKCDKITMPGGLRCVSLENILPSDPDYKNWMSMNKVFHLSFKKYSDHGAKMAILGEHNLCAGYPKYKDKKEEERDHIKSLKKAAKIIKEKYPQIKKFIIFYIILNEKTNEIVKIKTSEI